MRLAKLTLWTAVAVSFSTVASSAFALLPAPLASAASAPSAGPIKTVTAAAVHSVVIGSGARDTVGDLEQLQRQMTLAEMRKKLRDLESGPAVSVSPPSTSTPASGVSQVVSPSSLMVPAPVLALRKTQQNNAQLPAAITFQAPIHSSFSQQLVGASVVAEPTAKVLRIIVVGGRSRADLIDAGKVTTVKFGDNVGDWFVSDISTGGVTVDSIQPAAAVVNAPLHQQAGISNLAISSAQLVVGQPITAQAGLKPGSRKLLKATDADAASTGLATTTAFPTAQQATAQAGLPTIAIPTRPADSSFTPPNLPPLPFR